MTCAAGFVEWRRSLTPPNKKTAPRRAGGCLYQIVSVLIIPPMKVALHNSLAVDEVLGSNRIHQSKSLHPVGNAG
ncbi:MULTISPECIES: hypothetical protein [unclassified Leptolyngbya]|uniref:hypothetical protein n=1 Tax=unclassified Leptolyngbya TaxID=2650499 RepID=UPI001686A2BC|nr:MULTISPECIES: hypothetical protein [unclassified Leptolyngbya]MBD2157478.1 hypothetical protein [Leptolyngbya sp. FACHB-16]